MAAPTEVRSGERREVDGGDLLSTLCTDVADEEVSGDGVVGSTERRDEYTFTLNQLITSHTLSALVGRYSILIFTVGYTFEFILGLNSNTIARFFLALLAILGAYSFMS